jgi:photosystem II stability/assembly factor-like uncharacterized protein
MRRATLGLAALAVGGLIWPADGAAEDTATTVAALARATHFHGLAVDAADPARVYLATHHGLYAVTADGKARAVSKERHDFMGFTAHPSEPNTLFSSGHPERGGNLGFMVSTDRGVTWRKRADGVGGPVDFHQMDASKVDPRVIYGVHDGLQASRDGGATWTTVGPAPPDLLQIAASAAAADTLYAATTAGLLRSRDAGRTWSRAYPARAPSTMVAVTPGGEIFAFIYGLGLVRASEPDLAWSTVSEDFGNAYAIHGAVDPRNARHIYLVTVDTGTRAQDLRVSRDGGATWRSLAASPP